MTIYGSVGGGIANIGNTMRARMDDNLRAVEEHQDNPQRMADRLALNNAYLQMANDVMNIILRNITAMQV